MKLPSSQKNFITLASTYCSGLALSGLFGSIGDTRNWPESGKPALLRNNYDFQFNHSDLEVTRENRKINRGRYRKPR